MVSLGSAQQRSQQFGRRKDVHRIIFAKGDRVTSVDIHPLFAIAGALVALVFAIGYLGATGYLMFRDDLLNTSRVRQVKIQNAYEDQLATLRIEIDRIASRQMLDQRSVENKIDRLLGLRASLEERQRAVNTLTRTATAVGIAIPDKVPGPRPHPNRRSHAEAQISPNITSSFASASTNASFPFGLVDQDIASNHIRTASHDLVDLNAIEESLNNERRAQAQHLRLISRKTVDSSKNIATVIRSLGFKAPTAPINDADAIGGPFEDAGDLDPITFDNSIVAFQENLNHLQKLKQVVQLFPLKKPLRNGKISSHFGRRLDPFLNRYAMHSGMDFKAPSGTPVFATGPGKVVKADWSGGYGRLVEIEHAGGIITRYAHLSSIKVAVGEKIKAGKLVGHVGSTGRSTGPHLHYETRLGKKPVNPNRFIKAGKRVNSIL